MECGNSTILPNGICALLPSMPVDGQVFIDSELVKWIYNAQSDLWERSGTATTVPLATDQSIGYMSYTDKNLLDSIPAVPGGFGIITDTKLLLQSDTNPDGVISGDIKLVSDSIDISCVDESDEAINYTPTTLGCPSAIGESRLPGLQFRLSDKFLKTLIVNLPGNTGRKGDKGDKGEQGEPGFAGGPAGRPGNPGVSIDYTDNLSGTYYNDIDGVTDTAIVNLEIVDDGSGCKLVVSKSKLNVSNAQVADKVIASPISRTVSFASASDCPTGLKEFSLAKVGSDDAPVNVSLVRLPNGSDKATEPVSFNPTYTLSQYVNSIVSEYRKLLESVDEAYGKEAKEYVENIDSKARQILSSLASDLASCEFNLPAVEYCITFRGCDQPAQPPEPPQPPQPPTPPEPPTPPSTDCVFKLNPYVNGTASNTKSMVEGSVLQFELSGTGGGCGPFDSSNWTWTIEPGIDSPVSSADFKQMSGTFKVTNGKGYFTIEALLDTLLEPTETFNVVCALPRTAATASYGPMKLTGIAGP
jgi:hypothetical protein